MNLSEIKEEIQTNEEMQKAIKKAFIILCDSYYFQCLFDEWVLSHMTKEELKNINPKKAFSILSIVRERFSKLINDQFELDNINIILTKDIMNEINPIIDELLKNDSKVMSRLKDIIQELANEFIEDGIDTEVSPYTLSKNDDKIGDIIEIDNTFSVDLGYRDAPFVFLNGNIKIGRESDTHSMLITRLIKDEESSPDYLRGEEAFEMTGDNELAFGHIANGLAFLEVVDNVNVNKVVDALIELSDINKVYDFNQSDKILKRLAKLV